jgi:hypothetical protein
MGDIERDLQVASQGSDEELRSLAYHPSSRVLEALLLNSNITEDSALIIAGRRNVSTQILEAISTDIRWKDSYRIVRAICKNPKTPQKISLSLLKSLRIFDLADLTRNQQVPVNIRLKAENTINEKILTLPLGIKITLAKKASSNVLMKLIEDGMNDVVITCLDRAHLIEGDICKLIHMKKIASLVIRLIANHPKWSLRYSIQCALIRNHHTPLSSIVNYLKNIKSTDLKELYNAPEVPSSTKPFLFRELRDREESEEKKRHTDNKNDENESIK